MTPALEAYLAALVRVLERRLGAGLVGAYLHGSAVLGGWREDRSDVDVLAVCAAAVDDPGLDELGQRLSVRALPCPVARGLEFGLVTVESAASPCAEPRFIVAHGRGGSSPHEGTSVVFTRYVPQFGRRLPGTADAHHFFRPDRTIPPSLRI